MDYTATHPEPSSDNHHAPEAAPSPVLPLERFLPAFNDNPCVTTPPEGGSDVVALGRADNGDVEVCRDGQITTLPLGQTAVPVTDPARQTEMLLTALDAVIAARRAAEHDREDLRRAGEVRRAEHADTMRRIREYAIENAYRPNHICIDGLNDFLREFDLEEFHERKRVGFTITGAYEVTDEDDRSEVISDAELNLRPDVGDLTGIDEDSITYIVVIDSVDDVN